MRRSQAEKLARVVEATLECVDARGVHAVTLQEIASGAGVSKATILSLFPTRDALVAFAVGDRFSRRVEAFVDPLTDLADRVESADAFIEVVTTAHASGAYTLEREELWQFVEVLVWSIEDGELTVDLAAAKRRILDTYERLTVAIDDRGWFHDDVGPMSAAILLMASSMARLRLGRSEISPDGGDDPLFPITMRALLRLRDPDVARSRHGAISERLESPPFATERVPTDDAVRERILVAAAEELAARGAQAFRVRVVMDRAAVSTTMIYKHFVNRDDLVAHAAELLKSVNSEAVRESLTNALDPTVTVFDGPHRDRMSLAIDTAYRSLRTDTPEAFRVGLNAMVTGRRVEVDEDMDRRRREYFETVARVFIQRIGLPDDIDPQTYVEIGPLPFFAGVVLVTFADEVDSEISLAAGILRVVESRISMEG